MSKNIFDLTGKVALVTGASSGLGAHFAEVLADSGAKVALLARRAEKLKALEEKIGADKALAISCDVTDTDSVKAAVAKTIDHFGQIDILVNSAGVATAGPSAQHSDEEWNRVIDTNLTATFTLCREVGAHMIERKYGRIINLGSIHSRVAMPGLPIAAYCASKGGVLMLTKALGAEWAQTGVTVNAIGPSYFPSEMTGGALSDPKFLEAIKGLCPMGRPGKVEELDGALLYFAAEASSFTTGQLLNVDGGWTAV